MALIFANIRDRFLKLIVNKFRATDSSISVDKQKVQKYQHLYCAPWFFFTLADPPGLGGGYSLKVRWVCAAKGLKP